MNKKRLSMNMSIGASSLFMIFVVLIMCVLAVLSYLKANSFYESTLRQTSISCRYYACETELLERYYQLDVDQLENLKIDDTHYQLTTSIHKNQILQLIFTKNNQKLEIVSLKTVNQEE